MQVKIVGLHNITNMNTSYFVDKAVVIPNTYKQLFKNVTRNKIKLSVVKISTKDRKHAIWREAYTKGITGIKKDTVGLPLISILELDLKNNADVNIEKGSWFMFYWYNPIHATRISARLGFIAILISLISIVLTLIK